MPPGVKISQLPVAADAITPTDVLVLVRAGATQQGAVSKLPVPIDARSFGAKGDGFESTTGTIALGVAVVNDVNGTFDQTDVGKLFIFRGAGAAGIDLVTTIASVQSATQATLAAVAGTAVAANGSYIFASNDEAAITAALIAATGGVLYFPPGVYGVTATKAPPSNTRIIGCGALSTICEFTGNTTILNLTGKTKISIADIRFSGCGKLGTAGRGAIWASATPTSRIRLTGVIVENVGTCGVVFDTTTDLIISELYVNNTAEHGLYLSNSNVGVRASGVIRNAGRNQGVSNVNGIKLLSAAYVEFIIDNALSEGILVETGATNVVVGGGIIRNGGARGLRTNASTTCVVNGVTFEHNVSGGVRDFGATSLHLNGCTFAEDLATAIQTNSGANGLSVSGGRTLLDGATLFAVDLTGNHATFSGFVIGPAVAAGYAMRAGATGTFIQGGKNQATGTPYSDAGTGTKIEDPAFRTALPIAAVDPATTMALVNRIRTDLIAAGLGR